MENSVFHQHTFPPFTNTNTQRPVRGKIWSIFINIMHATAEHALVYQTLLRSIRERCSLEVERKMSTICLFIKISVSSLTKQNRDSAARQERQTNENNSPTNKTFPFWFKNSHSSSYYSALNTCKTLSLFHHNSRALMRLTPPSVSPTPIA